MSSSFFHFGKDVADGNHILPRFSVANSSGRGTTTITCTIRGAHTIVAADVGSLVRQEDNNTLWILTSTGPAVWEEVGHAKSNRTATTSPGVNDDDSAGYAVTSMWCNTALNKVWVCVDASTGAANWVEVGSGGGGGSGDVVGPAGATDNAIARYDTATGKLIQNSGITIGDAEEVVGVASVQFKDVSAPANPGAGLGEVYKKTGNDGLFWKPDAAGAEVDLTDKTTLHADLTDTATDGHPATAISNTPAGNIIATDVQGAIDELDGDKAAGAVSSTDNAVVRFDGTGGKTLQNSGVTIDDSNNLAGVANIESTGYIELTDMSAPANPSAGEGRLYKKTSDDGLFWKPDAAGAEIDVTKRLITTTFHWSVVLLYDTDGDNWYHNNNTGDYRYPYWMRGEEESWGSSTGGTVAPSTIPNNIVEGFTVPVTGNIVSITLSGCTTTTNGMDVYFCLMGATHTNEGVSITTVTKNEIVSPMMLWNSNTNSTTFLIASTEGEGTTISINSAAVTACDTLHPLVAVNDPGAIGSTRCELDFIGHVVIEEE